MTELARWKELERWKNKVALITGASAGIGKAVAEVLAEVGMRVVISARREDRLAQLKAQLEEKGAEVLALPVDLGDDQAIAEMFETVRAKWGGVDVLVNNAGIGYSDNMVDTDLPRLKAMLDVNVWAVTVCIMEALKDMKTRPEAAIINISSLAGHRVVPARKITYYAATKFAIRALSEGLRSEFQQKKWPIKIGMVSPGVVETEFHQMADPGQKPTEYASAPLKAEDIADSVLYILGTPPHVQVGDVLIRPIEQIY